MKGLERVLEQVKTEVKSNTTEVKKVEDSVEELKKMVERYRRDMDEAIKATEKRMANEWREIKGD